MSAAGVVWLMVLGLAALYAVVVLSNVIVNVGADRLAILAGRLINVTLVAGPVFASASEVSIRVVRTGRAQKPRTGGHS